MAAAPILSGYDLMRQHHAKAYTLVSEALDLDESGLSDKATVIDLYSQGATELEKGINVKVNVTDENAGKAEKLRQGMLQNLTMARDRVQDLLEGKELKGSNTDLSLPKVKESSESARTTLSNKKHPVKTKISSKPYNHKPQRSKVEPSTTRSPRGQKKGINTGDGKHLDIKGVDPSLVELIMSEIQDKDTNVSWDDIVGLPVAKRLLKEIVVLPALNPELFVGLRTPAKGLLLFGPPGNGKTMLAKAVAHESKSTFFSMSASSLTSKYVGEGEKLVKAMFCIARQLQPSIIFIDEVDSLLSRRKEGEHDAMRRLKNEFLLQFDGMGTSECDRFLVMGATNRPDEMDDAALRRFTKRIYIPLPDFEARLAVLVKLLAQHKHNLTDIDLSQIASQTHQYSFSDLTNLAKDAALGPIRGLEMESVKSIKPDEVQPITYDNFLSSLSQIRPSVTFDAIKSLEEWNALYGMGP